MGSGVVSVAPEVAELLGSLVVARLRKQRGDMVCCVCRTEIDVAAGDDASVVVEQQESVARVVFAHPPCMASQVIGDVQPIPGTDSERVDVVSAAVVLPTIDGSRPWLFIQQRGGQRILTPAGDEIDPYLGEFLSRGWDLLGALGRPAQPVSTAVLVLDRDGHGTLTATDGEMLLDRLPQLPDSWVDLVDANGWVDVGVGDFGLVRGRQETVQPSAFMRAAKRGGLVAGRVPVRLYRSTGAGGDSVAADLGLALQEVVSTRARPGGSDKLSHAPDVVAWTRPPQLYQLEITDGFAGLWIDLNDPDRTRAAATLAAFESEGLPRRRSLFDDGYFAVGPRGWGALVWRSQILVLGGQTADGEQRKLLFRQLPADPGWYHDIKQAGSVGILVGNLRRQPDTAIVERAMSNGDVLACVVTAMIA